MENGKQSVIFILFLIMNLPSILDKPSHFTINDAIIDTLQSPKITEPLFEFKLAEGDVVPPRGLVGWWPGDGHARDIIGGNDGTMYFDTTFASGLIGEAFSFDGYEDIIVIPSEGLRDLQQLTIETWVYHNTMPDKIERYVTLDGEKAVLRHDGTGERGHLHFYMRFSGLSELQHIFVEDQLQVGVFHHVAGTYDGSFMRLYLDGREVGHLHVSETVYSEEDVAFFSNRADETMDGILDEISIYNRALSGKEIRAIYEAGRYGKCKPPDTLGPYHDLQVTLGTPIVAYVNHSISIDALVENEGAYDETDIELQIWFNDALITTQVYSTVPIDGSVVLTHEWTPIATEVFNITAYTVPVTDENYICNNIATELIQVTDGEILIQTDPVLIASDEGFESQRWPGNGTEENPYIISGLNISNEYGCIAIFDTDSHFIIKNCQLSATRDSPIYFLDVWNAVVLDNVVEGGAIFLDSIGQSTIIRNEIVNSNWAGIYILVALNCVISHNIISNANSDGIFTESSEECIYTGNQISGCFNGINIFGDINSNFTYNYIIENWHYGINLEQGVFNRIFGNFLSNNLNARDFGTDNQWDNGISIGNCWEIRIPSNQIRIEGNSESVDNYPLFVNTSDRAIPIINSPRNILVEYIDERLTIQWVVWSTLGTYVLYENGTQIETGDWAGSGLFQVTLYNLTIGTLNYTLVVYDANQGMAIDSVFVTVSLPSRLIPVAMVIISSLVIGFLVYLEIKPEKLKRYKIGLRISNLIHIILWRFSGMKRSVNPKSALILLILVSTSIISIGLIQLYNYNPLDESMSGVRVALYNGEGAWDDEEVILTNLVKWIGSNVSTVRGSDIIDGCLDNFDILVWPGGHYPAYWDELGLTGKAKIQAFVSSGGGYLGICAGAYYACDYMVWMDDDNFPPPDYKEEGDEYNLDLFPGVAYGPIFEIANRPDPGWAMAIIDIVDRTHPITDSFPEQMTMFYYGGPYIIPYDETSVSILGRYNLTAEPAIVSCEYDQGHVFLIGPHPEIEENDDRDGWRFPDLNPEPTDPESDWPLLKDAIRWLSNSWEDSDSQDITYESLIACEVILETYQSNWITCLFLLFHRILRLSKIHLKELVLLFS